MTNAQTETSTDIKGRCSLAKAVLLRISGIAQVYLSRRAAYGSSHLAGCLVV